MNEDSTERAKAQTLGREILALDDAILGIIVCDGMGRSLAYLSKGSSGTKVVLDEAEIERIGLVESLALKMTPRPGQDTGETEYLACVYERARILVTELRKPKYVIGLRLTRSSNMEYIINRVRRAYR